MSRFLVLNFEDFGLNQDISKTIQSCTLSCICCLEKNVSYVNLSTCNHAKILDLLSKPVLTKTQEVLCYRCHNMLIKIDDFIHSVEKSFAALNGTIPEDTISNQSSNNLSYNSINYLEIPPIKTESDRALETHTTISDEDSNISTKHDKKTLHNTDKLLEEKCGKFIEIMVPIVSDVINRKNNVDFPKMMETMKSIKAEKGLENGNERCDVTIEIKKEKDVVKMENCNNNKDITDQLSPTQSKHSITNVVKLSKKELIQERLHLSQSAVYRQYPYKCELCLIGFNFVENLEDHQTRKHGPKVGSVTCEICLQVLHPPGSLTAHNYRHYTRYECVVCKNRSMDMAEAGAHYRNEHKHTKSNKRRITTKVGAKKKKCKEKSGKPNDKRMKPNVTQTNSYCSECKMQFKTLRAYRIHKKTSLAHTNIK